MTISKLTLAVAAVLGAGATFSAYAIDLYVDVKTKQIYAEPGPHRQLMGSFVQVDEAAALAASKPAESAELASVKEDLELKTNEIKALQEHMTAAEEFKVKVDKNGLQAESADKKYKFKLGGRIHADSVFSGNDDLVSAGTTTHREASDGTYIRRARMRFEGVFDKDWLFRTEADFADDNVRMKDIFIEYNGWDSGRLTLGQQKQNFSRELQESSNDMMFMERSLMDVLNNPTVDRAIGVNYETKGSNWVAKLGAYGDSITPARTDSGTCGDSKATPESCKDGRKNAGDEGWGVSSRLIYNPILEKDKLIHLGVAGNYRTPDDTGDVAKGSDLHYRYRTTNNQTNLSLLDTKVENVDDIKMLGLEAAGLYGPFSVGGEYTHTWVQRKDGSPDLSLDGWYAEAAWSITGESRQYKEGNFRYLKPAKKFNLKNGTWGAWELATRWSEVNLNDREFRGGQMSQLTVALNWYINENVRFLADYNRNFNFNNPAVTYTNGSDPDSLNTFMMRAQVAY